jgi:hypothetical protein
MKLATMTIMTTAPAASRSFLHAGRRQACKELDGAAKNA